MSAAPAATTAAAVASAASELELLERVQLRIVMCDTDEKTQAQVASLLCPLLLKAASPHQAVREKLLAILTHLNKILKSRTGIQLPVDALVAQTASKEVPEAVKSFTKIYLEMGYSRLTDAGKAEVAPKLLCMLKDRPEAQQTAFLRMTLPVLHAIKFPLAAAEKRVVIGCDHAPTSKLLLDFLRDVFLLNNSSNQAQTIDSGAAAPGAAPSAAPPAPSAAAPAIIPAGISKAALARVLGEPAIACLATRDAIVDVKLNLIKFLTEEGLFQANEVLPLLVIASGDNHHQVAQNGEVAYRRFSQDLEDAATLQTLMMLFLGSPPTVKDAAVVRSAASPKVRLFIMGLLNRSRLATDMFPATLQIIFNCLFAPDTLPKLRYAGLLFTHRAFDFAQTKSIAAIAPLMLTQLVKLTDDATVSLDCVGLAFSAIGKLARRAPEPFQGNYDLLARLFQASHTRDTETRAHVQEALKLIRECYARAAPEMKERIASLLLEYVQREEPHCRLTALQYANTVFSRAHVSSRFVCLLACTDDKDDIREEAEKGLTRRVAEGSSSQDTTHDYTWRTPDNIYYPAFPDILTYLLNTKIHTNPRKRKADEATEAAEAAQTQSQAQPMDTSAETTSDAAAAGTPQLLPFSSAMMGRVLRYLRQCLGVQSGAWEDEDAYVKETGVVQGRLKALHDFFIAEDAAQASGLIESYRRFIETALAPSSSSALHHEALTSLLELVAAVPEHPIPDLLAYITQLNVFIHSTRADIREVAAHLVGLVAERLSTKDLEALQANLLRTVVEGAGKASALDARHGAILTIGYSISGVLPRLPENEAVVKRGIALLVETLRDKDSMLAVAACKALGEIGRAGPLPFPDGDELPADGPIGKEMATDTTLASVDSMTKRDVVLALIDIVRREKLKGDKLQEGAALSLGLIGVGDFPHPHYAAMMHALCSLSFTKLPELHFTVGLALSCLGAGHYSKASADAWHLATKDVASLPGEETHMEGMTQLTTILDDLFGKWVCHNMAAVRQAAGVWLVSIVKYCDTHPAVTLRLGDIQTAFSDLLAEGDEFTQDIASKGLGLVYDLGDEDMRKHLVRTLVDTLSEGHRSGNHKYTADSEDRVFEEGAIGSTKEGDKLSTYKELCSLASDLNQPDLIYRFMHLANHNMTWNSKKGAAFGFGKIAAMAGDQLAPFLPTLLPKLYRYQYDPNRQIQESMKNIWKTMITDSTAAVDKYFQAILKDLMANITSKTWRVRESCALALADLLRGRTWADVRDHLVDLWRVCFRIIDDVKESVRVAGDLACKRLMKMTVELSKSDKGASSKEVVAAVLPIMMEEGLISPVKDVKAISLVVMLDMAKEAGEALKPHITVLIMTLLEALSGIESPYLNYLGQRLSRVDGLEERLDDARISSSQSSELTKCIDDCVKFVDAATLVDLVPALITMTKKGLGASTKSGCARLTVNLVTHCRAELSPFAEKLMRTMLAASTIKSAPVRRDFSNALGALVRIAPPTTVEGLLKKVQDMYLEHASVENVEASAVVCRAIAVKAGDVFRAHATAILPLAFYGMYDPSKVVQDVWKDTWSENAPGMEGGIKLYFDEIMAIILPQFSDRNWEVKKQAAAALSEVSKYARKDLLGKHVEKVAPVIMEEAIKGRTWEGKDAVVGALVNISAAAQAILSEKQALLQTIIDVVFKECNKKDLEYKALVLPHFSELMKAFPSDVYFEKIAAIAEPLLSSDKMDVSDDEETGDKRDKVAQRATKLEEIKIKVFQLLSQGWPVNTGLQHLALQRMWLSFMEHLASSTWKVRAATLEALKSFMVAAAKAWKAGDEPLLNGNMIVELLGHIKSAMSDQKQSLSRVNALDALAALSVYLVTSSSNLPPIAALYQEADMMALTAALGDDGVAKVRERAEKAIVEVKKVMGL